MESKVHVLFETEKDLLEAMQHKKPAGYVQRCSGSYQCAHSESDIKELVVLDMEWASFQLQPSLTEGEDQKRFVTDIKKRVSAISGAVVDKAWVRKATISQRAKCYVHLQLHSSDDVDKVLSVESKLANLHHAMSVLVDVKNDPTKQLCIHCKERGHNNKEFCPKFHGEKFAIQAIFNEPVSELGRKKIASLHEKWGPCHSIFTGSRIGSKFPVRAVYLTYATEDDMKNAAPHFLAGFQEQLRSAQPLEGYARIKGCDECGGLDHQQRQCSFAARRGNRTQAQSYSAALQGRSRTGTQGSRRSSVVHIPDAQLKRGSISQSSVGPSRLPGSKGRPGECWSFRDEGWCKYGKNCRFLHNSSTPRRADTQRPRPPALVDLSGDSRRASPQLSPASRPNGKDERDDSKHGGPVKDTDEKAPPQLVQTGHVSVVAHPSIISADQPVSVIEEKANTPAAEVKTSPAPAVDLAQAAASSGENAAAASEIKGSAPVSGELSSVQVSQPTVEQAAPIEAKAIGKSKGNGKGKPRPQAQSGSPPSQSKKSMEQARRTNLRKSKLSDANPAPVSINTRSKNTNHASDANDANDANDASH